MIRIDKELVRKMARAEILGSGGGRSYISEFMALQLLNENKTTYLTGPDDVPNNALMLSVALMGSPLILKEKLPNRMKGINILKLLENYSREETYALFR